MAHIFLRLAVAVVFNYFALLAAAEQNCIRDYHDLEEDMLGNPLNIDSLVRSFFSPNEPLLPSLEVHYRVSNSSDPDQHPLVSNIVGPNETEQSILAEYHYRWSQSPVFLLIEPIVLERLSLYTFRSHPHSVKLVVSPLCNYTIDDVPLPVDYLNQMTVLVSVQCVQKFMYSYLTLKLM